MKKELNIRIIVITIITLFLFNSCTDWMQLEPEDKLTRQEFWQKEDDVYAVTAAMYDAFRETSLKSLMLGEARADMIAFNSSNFGDIVRIAQGDISPSNNEVKWEKYYFTINLANTLIQFMPDVLEIDKQFTETEMQWLHAEALFIRSLSYFYLVRLWKEVPLLLSASSSDTVDFYVEKSKENVVLNQIISDLEYAETIANTKEYIYDPMLFKGRANKYSIQALLADIYLWKENYEKCIEYCNKVISSGLFRLEEEATWFQLYYPGNSKESIFEIQYSEKLKEANPIYNVLLPISGSVKASYKDLLVEELFQISDIRACWDAQGVTAKYLKKDALQNIKREISERDANFIYYRYADILLIKAEALAEIGKYTESQALINEITTRAGNASIFLNESLEEFRNAILAERAREFAFEGKRWFDLLRFAKKNKFENKSLVINIILNNSTPQLKPILRARISDTMSYYLPVPEADLQYNKKLSQNPFYDR